MSHLFARQGSRRAAPIIGLVIGLALGLVYTWTIAPAEPVNTYPALLRTDYRWDWIRLAALSYVADDDLERARARLDGLDQEDVAGVIRALIEEHAAAGRPADTLRRLTALADVLDVHTPAMLVYLHTPTLSSYPTPTLSPSSTPTLSPTPPAPPLPHFPASPLLHSTQTLTPSRLAHLVHPRLRRHPRPLSS